jgi:signal transduction histidine kinase
VADGWRAAVSARLWSRRTWRAVAHLARGAVLWVVPLGVVVALASLIAAKRGVLSGLPKGAHIQGGFLTLAVGLLVLVALTPRYTARQRNRFRRTLGVELAPFPPYRPELPRWRRVPLAVLSGRTRRQVAYHAFAGAFSTAATAAFLASPVAAAGLGGATLRADWPGPTRLAGVVAGLVLLLFGAPLLACGAVAVDLRLARALLQPSTVDALTERVESLSASRAGVVDAADAERRRIERNLHDGTQQRLVSLAMNLGLTRAAVRDADPVVREAVVAAHEEAKLALAELRDFIRGLHPAILHEQGLDAALSGIAARSPVPVALAVDLPTRPPPTVEAVAYFVVSEALTNAARHAGATRVDVAIGEHPGQLSLSITDDGRGGADPSRGTGLRGLRQRVESVDGTWLIVSPPGGPTTILVTLPCAW